MKSRLLSLCLSFLLVLPVLTVAPMTQEAQAISRYTSTAMSCGKIKSVVRNEGAVILRWSKAGAPMYGRFVAGSGYCDSNEAAVPANVPSASGQCTVNKCKRCDFAGPRNGRIFGIRPFNC